ncbi:hypothetical protein N0V90_007481 [Kalmusia sp. IMI 367209]|nr:hypothetical protein N0V90_007481 [Kalmusia sp. IMI 367209]
MKLSALFAGCIATLAAAQTATPYTDAKSGITFNTFQHTSGYFFGIALPDDPTGNTDFIATLGVATGTFTQSPIANGTYVNSTHWTYTFLCSKCIQTDGTTFAATANSTSFGYALNAAAPSQKANAASAVSKHTAQGQVTFDLVKARSKDFATWKTWAVAPKIAQDFQG